MTDAPWQRLSETLDALHAHGKRVNLWLRDDDAIAPSPALDRLLALSDHHKAPLLLAVIPKRAVPELAEMLIGHPLVSPCQHGFSHRNHASPPERAQELGLQRPIDIVLQNLADGRERLQTLFGSRLEDVLVPPWNRMDDRLLPPLETLGFNAVSRFGKPALSEAHGLALVNCQIDIIDWKRGKSGRPATELVTRMEDAITATPTGEITIGILAHHLDHDETAWSGLGSLIAVTKDHPAAQWIDFRSASQKALGKPGLILD